MLYKLGILIFLFTPSFAFAANQSILETLDFEYDFNQVNVRKFSKKDVDARLGIAGRASSHEFEAEYLSVPAKFAAPASLPGIDTRIMDSLIIKKNGKIIAYKHLSRREAVTFKSPSKLLNQFSVVHSNGKSSCQVLWFCLLRVLFS